MKRMPIALAVLTIMMGSAVADNYAVATKWRLTGEPQIECMGHADEAVRRAGFELAEPGSQSIMGRRGDYTASIRCITEQRIVFFVVTGPSPAEVNRLLNMIYNVF